jgi:DHA3 family tetracycline resistance protein-like MFS transporter
VRDFALYWTGRTISYLGDGVMVVALPWQVYELTDSPAAMGVIGGLQTASIFVFVLLGGVAADRFQRKRIIIAADLVRGAAAGIAGVLALAGSIELWHLGILVVVFGIAQGLAGPAFGSILPQLVPDDLLMQANSAIFTVHPLAFRFLGPALGGIVIAVAGTGAAFLMDAASFLIGAIAIAFLAARPAARLLAAGERRTVVQDIREGVAYVRGRSWLWGTFTWMLVVFPLTTAPYVVLLPYLVKNELGGDSRSLGLVFAAGGVGAIVMSLVLSQVSLPRRHTAFMFAMFTFATLDLIAYSLVEAPWQAMVVAFVAECALTAGILVWNTLLPKAVPTAMLGRVRSLDWLAAFGLTPLGYVFVGQAADVFGVRPVMAACGLAGLVLTAGVLLIPGIRQLEGKVSLSSG